MTTCVVEFTVLIPEFPGGCGGKGGMLEKRKRERDLWLAFWGEREGEKKKGKRKKKKKRDKKTTHIN